MEISRDASLGDAFAEFAEESLVLAEEMLPAAAKAWAIADKEPRGVRVARMWLEQIAQARHGVPPDRKEAQRVLDHCFRNRPCNDCAAPIGQPHEHGCDVERCQYAGAQWITCGGYSGGIVFHECQKGVEPQYDDEGYTIHTCSETPHDCGSEVWDGVWPSVAEAVEFGWFSRFVPNFGWVGCGPGDFGASPDLNRLCGGECVWDRDAKRWARR